MNDLHISLLMLTALPAAAGTLCILIPRKLAIVSRLLCLGTLVITSFFAIVFLVSSQGQAPLTTALIHNDALARTMVLIASIMSLLIFIYSLCRSLKTLCTPAYCSYFIWTLALANATFFSNNLMFLVILWGALGITLFLLINLKKSNASAAAAKKTLIIIGGTDSLLILGIALLAIARGCADDAVFSQTLMGSTLTEYSGIAVAAFLCILSAALAKAGALPFHTWVPDVAETSSAPISALLPASLDKALGIYLLLRLIHTCQFVKGTWLQTLLLAIGALTIVVAVFMALVQHDLKRLLGYHAVSQVGYMVLGIATLTPIGILGGVFHMLNHIMYKSMLFLGAGSVEAQTGTTDMDKLGGLGRRMPVTFACMTVGALAISGVPPLNGFMSKWFIYQGTIELGPGGGAWIIWLTAAMFGSALTLASFVKVLHAVFLANPKSDVSTVRESGPAMQIPMLILAAGCILFGVAAWMIPIKKLLMPALNINPSSFDYMRPFIVTLLLFIALGAGALIFLLSRLKMRCDEPHIGGETFKPEMKISGTDFYQTIADLPLLRTLYRLADKKWFDIYEVGIRITNYITGMLRAAHQGYLYAYVTWCLVGLAVIISLLMIW